MELVECRGVSLLLTRSQGIQRLVEPSETEPPVTRKREG